MDDLVVRSADVFKEKQGIDLQTGHQVLRIDRENMTLSGEAFRVAYDKLLIATGASAVKPELPGFDLPGVLTLKSLSDGRRIKDFIRARKVSKAVIIGMGYIALEMGEALLARDIQVEMVKPRPTLLPWMNPELAAVIRDELEKHGVGLHPGNSIQRIEGRKGRLQVICDNQVLEAQMVLVAAGVKPNSDLAARAGLELGPAGSIAVDDSLQTSDKNIYAAGDCADAYHVVTGGKTWIPLALRANRAGWAVADNVVGREVRLPGVAGTAVFKVLDLQVARTGLSIAEAERFGFRPAEAVIKSRSRAHAHPGNSAIWVQMVGDIPTGRLLGAQLVGREGAAHRVNAVAVALHRQMTVEAFSQCDLAYAPPFGPVWDPLLTAANQLLKKL
jgi:NADPH-dependent 2,4-dienoyl-CoA reductase/sulfur reductase-like enzyme